MKLLKAIWHAGVIKSKLVLIGLKIDILSLLLKLKIKLDKLSGK